MQSVALDLIEPTHQWMPPFVKTYGDEVADLCASVGYVPDPEQRLALDWMFAVGPDGRSVVRDFGVCAPRQNMKTGLLKMAALGWLYVSELRLVVWSAHEFSTAQEAFRDMCLLIEDNPDLDREVKRTSRGKVGISRGNGDEAIELRGDRRLKFKARTKVGGRGLTGDRVVLDEAMYLQPDTMAALAPTLRAVRDPQLVYAGSGGLRDSTIWRSVRDRGRAGGDPSVGWMEYSDPRPWECGTEDCEHGLGAVGCALDDEDRLARVNTALGRRITIESLQSDRRGPFRAIPRQYATETLGWWDDPPELESDEVLSGWAGAAGGPVLVDPVCLGVDVAADGRSAAIVACDGATLEVVEWRRGGVGWVPDRVAELRAAHKVSAVGLMGNSPAAALAQHLPGVHVLTGGDSATAQQSFAQAINETRLRHRSQPPLDVAVSVAVRQLSGDGWRWSRRLSRADISPLLAAVVAAHLARSRVAYNPLDNIF